MPVVFGVSTVRELKGAALSIVCLLALERSRVNQEYIERNTNYTDKPTSQALAYLVEHQFIDKTRSGYALSPGFQLPLMRLLDDEASASRNNSDSALILDLPGQNTEVLINNNNNKSRKVSDSVLDLLGQASIKLNDRVLDMLELPHVTEGYLRAKIAEYKSSGQGGSRWAGMLIKAIERGDPAPAACAGAVNPNGHPVACECVKCKLGRSFNQWQEAEE